MHLGEAGLMIVSTLVILCGSTIGILPIFQKWIRQFREMTELLEEADPTAFRVSFREYVAHKTSVTGYIQDACPFRTEPFEDSFLLERFEILEVWRSRASAVLFMIGVTFIVISMAFVGYLFFYLGGFSKDLPMAAYLTIMTALLFVSMFLTVRHMLSVYRLNRALADRFARALEG